MATYYRWRKSTIKTVYDTETKGTGDSDQFIIGDYSGAAGYVYYSQTFTDNGNGTVTLDSPQSKQLVTGGREDFDAEYYISASETTNELFQAASSYDVTRVSFRRDRTIHVFAMDSSGDERKNTNRYYNFRKGPGTFLSYVYTTSSDAYPNGGVSGNYYYDQRTTVTSPTAPTGLTYPNPITTPTVTVSWNAATSNTDYPVDHYLLSAKLNDLSNAYAVDPVNVSGTSGQITIPSVAATGEAVTSVKLMVSAVDTNGQSSGYTETDSIPVYFAPTLTVPQMVMQGQQATISWTAIEGADSYTVQRKANTDADWTQVYSGANLSYTETVGTWTSLQYRVCAVFGSTNGGWATSGDIQIVSASALVISGSDGDLGILTNDVQYSISSDQTSPTIDVTVEVNGGEYAAFQATSGQTYTVSVLDLPTGTGSIVITASTEVSSSPVTVTRTWTYSKTAITFPETGSVADLTQQGNTIWAKTIAEAVRTPGIWGGNLGLALGTLARSVLYNPNQVAKYSEVTVNLANVTVGQEVNLPYNGAMVPHIVVHIGNPNAGLYDASCDGVWMLRNDIAENGHWNSTNVNTLPNSTIMQTMAEYVANYANNVQAAIKTVKIPYCVGNGSSAINSGANGLECKVFPLSGREVGLNSSAQDAVDGAKLEYFLSGDYANSQQKRIAKLDGIDSDYWLRSPNMNGSATANYISSSGSRGGIGVTSSKGLRPAFIMPTTFTATYYVDQGGAVHDSQEYEEAGTFTDISGGTIPMVSIETGSYVGTGTYGASNPTTLTTNGTPMVLFVTRRGAPQYATLSPAIFGCQSFTSARVSTTRYAAQCSWGKNSVSYYNSSSADYQLNTSGATFDYLIITLPGGDTE